MQDASNLSQDGPEDSPPSVEPPRPGNNLPLQLTSFVGRERETEQARGLLEENRLLTLSGPGGSGKTRLALAIASEVAWDFEDGAWLVELASLSDLDLVPQAVASVLGVRGLPGGTPLDSATALLEESMAAFRQMGDEGRAATCATYVWMAALERGDYGRAASLLRKDLRRSWQRGTRLQAYDGLLGLAIVAARFATEHGLL